MYIVGCHTVIWRHCPIHLFRFFCQVHEFSSNEEKLCVGVWIHNTKIFKGKCFCRT